MNKKIQLIVQSIVDKGLEIDSCFYLLTTTKNLPPTAKSFLENKLVNSTRSLLQQCTIFLNCFNGESEK